MLTKLIKCALNIALKLTLSLFLFFFAFGLHFRPPKHCLIPLFERQFFIQTTVERRKEKVHFIGDLGPLKWEFWHYLSRQHPVIMPCVTAAKALSISSVSPKVTLTRDSILLCERARLITSVTGSTRHKSKFSKTYKRETRMDECRLLLI